MTTPAHPAHPHAAHAAKDAPAEKLTPLQEAKAKLAAMLAGTCEHTAEELHKQHYTVAEEEAKEKAELGKAEKEKKP